MKKVYGFIVDDETRCTHYQTKKDIIAIKFKCCDKYYPCYKCHAEAEDHKPILWEKAEYDEKAVLCGVCRKEHTIDEYLQTDRCLKCASFFNEACEYHYHLYWKRE